MRDNAETKRSKGGLKAIYMKTLGCVDISAQPNQGADEMQKAQVARSELIEARKDMPEVLDLVDKTLDQVTFAVQPAIIRSLSVSALVRRDHGDGSTGNHHL
jgi:hypothetical protein